MRLSHCNAVEKIKSYIILLVKNMQKHERQASFESTVKLKKKILHNTTRQQKAMAAGRFFLDWGVAARETEEARKKLQ